MKLNEIPKSLISSLKMRFKSLEDLRKREADQIPVIITLTTIPSRIGTLHLTIRSLLLQDAQPEKIVLWLNDDFKNRVPKNLSKLVGDVFEIRFSPYLFSHRKLIHSLDAFPDKILVTSDDDLIYPSETLGNLYQSHLKQQGQVVAHNCREITYENGVALPYLKWPFTRKPLRNELLLMPVGAFLVLYPPGILSKDATNIELFTKISPRSDDLWFKTMTILNHKKSVASIIPAPEPIPIWGTQKVALKKTNNNLDQKRVQWEQIEAYYGNELLDIINPDRDDKAITLHNA
ncbi:glycosyl transferase [Nonlabens arenilitoris]|uniref:Glycosyl transferase n=1 Tax=Nonlabens arenilitoris TaxID=1217969 RepID=A0A2S7UCR1_9FLAO|nr:glycosyl transferase [Nonlabens arenilitoris]PQJ32073.1 glycosyl transferase [Nonlabens arenilitoris]